MSIKESAAMPDSGSVSNESTNHVSEPIEISGGSGAISFDELQSVKENVKTEEEKPVKEEKVAKEEEKEEKEEEEKPAPKEKVAAKKQNDKLYKVKLGDKDVELTPDGKMFIQVGGKDQEVSVQDLVNSYHGSKEIHRRLSQLDLDRKAYERNNSQLEAKFKKINELFQSNKPVDMLNYIIEQSGLDPALYTLDLYDKLSEPIQQWSALTPEEKQYRKLQIENESLKRQQAKQQEKYSVENSQRELEQEVKKVQQTYGLTNESFLALYDELVKKGHKEDSITPKMIAEYADEKSVFDYVGAKVSELAPDLEDSEELVAAIVEELSTNKALDIEDLDDLIKSITANEEDKQLEEKVSSKKKKSTEKINPMTDMYSFDQLADL